ncbi:hypothetical protein FRB99_008321 [Tulasnella sp. 403]|nr:hypothetical protein FRB99_008321 [Tulasnella sp. 403]
MRILSVALKAWRPRLSAKLRLSHSPLRHSSNGIGEPRPSLPLEEGIRSLLQPPPTTLADEAKSMEDIIDVDTLLKTSHPIDALLLLVNTLVPPVGTSDASGVGATLRPLFERHITNAEEARSAINAISTSSDSFDSLLAQTALVRAVEVLVKTRGLSFLDPAISLFLQTIVGTPPTTDIGPPFRHVTKLVASLPKRTRLRAPLLLRLLRFAREHKVMLDPSTYGDVLRLEAHGAQLAMAVRRHVTSTRRRMTTRLRRHVSFHLSSRTLRNSNLYIPPHKRPKADAAQWWTLPSKSRIVLARRRNMFRPPRKSALVRRYLLRTERQDDVDSARENLEQRKMSIPAWRAYLNRSILQSTASPNRLRAIFWIMETDPTYYPLNVSVFTSFMKAFIERKMWKDAWKVWRRLQSRCLASARIPASDPQRGPLWRMDRAALTAGVTILCRYRQDLIAAFRVIHYNTSIEEFVDVPERRTPVDGFLITRFMDELRRRKRYDLVFPFWKEMATQYGVQRNNFTLVTLLDAATWGSIGGETEARVGGMEGLATTMADRFHRLLSARRRSHMKKYEDLADFRFGYRIEVILGERKPHREDLLWDGMIAWQRARLVFLEVMLGNWPGLKLIESPVTLDTLGSETAELLEMSNLRKPWKRPSWTQPSQAQLLAFPPAYPPVPWSRHIEFLPKSDPHEIPPPPSKCLYPHIIPNDTTFRAYIQLLGEHGLSEQIPLTLAWMRALKITPSLKTLSYALSYYREVTDSMQPLLLAYAEDGKRGSYNKLVCWIDDWVPHLVPSEANVITAWKNAKLRKELEEREDARLYHDLQPSQSPRGEV